jgi:hypothetical protein
MAPVHGRSPARAAPLHQAQLPAADRAIGDKYGSAVAVSGDTAVVGAPEADPKGKAAAGAAYIFARSSGVWKLQEKLTAVDAAFGDHFGWSVAVSGNTVIVGAPDRDTWGTVDAGAAYAFARSGATWTARPTLTAAAPATGDWFGSAVAVSGDTILVGAPHRQTAGMADAGTAYAFQPRPRIAKLSPASARRGAIVTISGAGFGRRRGTSYVKFGTRRCTGYVSWSTSRIKCRLPAKAATGIRRVRVTLKVGTSNSGSFRVKR